MCSCIFGPIIMDNYQGDLTDIVRASGGAYGGGGGGSSSCSTGTSSAELPTTSHHHTITHTLSRNDHWHQHFSSSSSSSDPITFSSVLQDPRGLTNFGDPFSTMRDPFLQELDMPSASSYFTGGLEEAAASFGASAVSTSTNTNASTTVFAAHKILEEHDMRRPCKNIFSNMIQISPNAKLPVSPYDSTTAVAPSPRAIKPPAVVSPNMVNANSSKDCLVDTTGVQISSPRNPGLKRRKNQAKKVVCIPAPAAANSRQTGEVVPSDLWAWRKYGQKPIKGSPYPRGYYRCSSSKGCSARKQVERSRTDPNMLVITYTSEHNHPWPTQRNALAGSTRSQPSKNNAGNSKSSEGSNPQKSTTSKAKDEQQQQQESNNSEGNVSPVVAGNSSANSASVKEENMEDIEKQFEMDEGEFSDGLPYKPCLMDQSNNQSEDFFAELGEIEADPLDILFTQGFGAADDQREESKALDPFHLFDWSGDNNTSTNSSSFEEPNAKRRL
ncbi:probable WRKY transcription factor 14 [Vigna radiata var. radiata]|uniref:Probable WRKY transcription factor 14 n=1 Tax=Vigna radiata var. radiata TaxID=3916 RepID=A0A3Q0FKS7_VIGRR|nr:probable WRKY transcription factor 14 [Vigna radiata var. radiata]